MVAHGSAIHILREHRSILHHQHQQQVNCCCTGTDIYAEDTNIFQYVPTCRSSTHRPNSLLPRAVLNFNLKFFFSFFRHNGNLQWADYIHTLAIWKTCVFQGKSVERKWIFLQPAGWRKYVFIFVRFTRVFFNIDIDTVDVSKYTWACIFSRIILVQIY